MELIRFFNNDSWYEWYRQLLKPSWTPSPTIISFVWTFLYPLIFVTFGYVFARVIKGKYPKKVAIPFFLNITTTLAFSPILFSLKNLPLAALDIVVIWITIVWSIIAIYKYSKLIAFLQFPYFFWVTIAMFLQIWILMMNK